MDIKEFVQQLNGRKAKRNHPTFSEGEIRTAKENGWVIVVIYHSGFAEFVGALNDDTDSYCIDKIYFSKEKIYTGDDESAAFPNCINVHWSEEQDKNGKIIPVALKTDIPHETFMVYEDGEPYCRGIIFSVNDLR